MAEQKLEIAGYSDTQLWTKEEVEDTVQKRAVYPITRFNNILNRPRVITSVAETPVANFHLLCTEEIEVNSDTLFDLIGQTW